ncbi:23S rRNA m(6)A-1618 methyltransferase [Williamwhitmania taraxaci]|uniref:Ribosomal RNA large subunit methyltransferase F n=1 Tax=Williamwhitmania taraxaci TaxID=1640674 RepID=A0A1G6KCV5_9BACT|nr:23S rRNA m(6)A-1618 methyltransferase [Williamwhitmania taraxaci]
MHPRNAHRFSYNFPELIACCSELAPFVFVNPYGNESIDFANPDAVKALNKALLSHFYNIKNWDIPVNYLCPPIPGRADYIHYLADLLADYNDGIIPRGEKLVGLDVGVGANCVYPIIGRKEYGWSFVGSDIDSVAVASAQRIVDSNPVLSNGVTIRLQPSSKDIFAGIIQSGEQFDFTLCNPPFHASPEEAAAGSERKHRNLGLDRKSKPVLNFGGQNNELWCEGGEEAFLRRMVEQSATISTQCFWFTSLVSKSASLPAVYNALRAAHAWEVHTIDMAQGQKISRIVAWTFLKDEEQEKWCKKRWGQ